ncbi:MAG: peptide ABC transporter substrate-binding protein, partial [Christensenellales bacterium]
MKKIVTFILLAAMALSCTAALAEAAPELAEEQVLNISLPTSLTDMNPLTESTEEGSNVLMACMETLVRQGENGAIEIGSGLAEACEISEDGTVYTFSLRDAKFSNGELITAQDFEYTWKKVLDPETASEYAYMLYTIAGAEDYNKGIGSSDDVGIKALDEKTLEVTLTGRTDYFLSTLVIPQFSVIPAHFDEECGEKFFLDADHVISCGPFMITEWIASQSITMEKNPKYWDADHVYLDKIVFNFASETGTIVNMYNSDMVDVMLVQADYLDMYRNEPGFVSIVEPVTEYLMFDFSNEYFANVHIRRAFSMALNRVSYMNDFMRTGSTPAYAYIPGPITGAGGKSFRENNGDLYTDCGNGNTPEDAVAELNKGLDELGKTKDEFNASGVSLVIGQGDNNLKTSQVFQQYWKNVLGIDVEIKSLQYAMRQAEYDKSYTIGKEGWGADYNDALSFLELFISD